MHELQQDGLQVYEMTKDQLAGKTKACFDKFDSDHSGL
jgi:hypothetical protein